jgi:DUF4097 and DUF4098 domain-containing protein YvlB
MSRLSRPLADRVALVAAVAVAAVLGAAGTAGAQSDRAQNFLDNCRRNRGDNEQFCETRDLIMPSGKSLTVDGRQNGGVTVHGWDQNQAKVVAMVQTQAGTAAEAALIAKQIVIAAGNGDLRANGPSLDGNNRESWSVSYEIWTPRHTDLALSASNGGISVDGLDARLELETVNGGLHIADVAGDVHGTTVNGGVTADLTGDRWRGTGLDLRTSNGGVRLNIPANYSAQLETGTVNGHLDVGFPVTVQGSIGRRFTTQLGGGGPMIRATTTKGGVSVRRQ